MPGQVAPEGSGTDKPPTPLSLRNLIPLRALTSGVHAEGGAAGRRVVDVVGTTGRTAAVAKLKVYKSKE